MKGGVKNRRTDLVTNEGRGNDLKTTFGVFWETNFVGRRTRGHIDRVGLTHKADYAMWVCINTVPRVWVWYLKRFTIIRTAVGVDVEPSKNFSR